jgi:hypothetical protein
MSSSSLVLRAAALDAAASAAADKVCPDRKAAKTCGHCLGKKKTTFAVSGLDVFDSILGTSTTTAAAAKEVVVDCVSCDGKGVSNAWREAYDAQIHCKCAAYHFPTEAPDGHAVFGNTTWLCRGCGKVSCFG